MGKKVRSIAAEDTLAATEGIKQRAEKGIKQESTWQENGMTKKITVDENGTVWGEIWEELDKTLKYCHYMRECESKGLVKDGVNGEGFVIPFSLGITLKNLYGIDMATGNWQKDPDLRKKLFMLVETEYPFLKTTNRTIWQPKKSKPKLII